MKKLFTDQGLVNTFERFITYNDVLTKTDYLRLQYTISSFMTKSDMSNGKFFINSHKIRLEFGRTKQQWKLKLLLDACIQAGILECGDYSFGNANAHSRIYRFTDNFINEYDREQLAIGFEEMSDKDYYSIHKNEIHTGRLKLQYDLLMSGRFGIDELAALTWIEENCNKHRRIKLMYSLLKLCGKKIFVSKDPNTGRIFTNFTNLKKELRMLCTIDGERLMSIDLKASQPLLFVNYLYSLGINTDELHAFSEIVIEKDVYNYFLEEYIKLNGDSTYTEFNLETKKMETYMIGTRADAKIEMFRFIFKTTFRGTPCPFQRVFQNLYPDLYKIVSEIKKTTNIAVMLQKLEADIFIPVASKYINKGALSLHDAIYFKKELLNDIMNDLEKSFEKHNIIGYDLVIE